MAIGARGKVLNTTHRQAFAFSTNVRVIGVASSAKNVLDKLGCLVTRAHGATRVSRLERAPANLFQGFLEVMSTYALDHLLFPALNWRPATYKPSTHARRQ